jgi:hypothetical protein
VRKEVNWTKIMKMKEPKTYSTRETKDEITNEEITNWKKEKKRVVKFEE